MPYRKTEHVARRLAAKREAILAAAESSAALGGMVAVQIAPVASRAGVAAGTVYRYFPGKNDLVSELLARYIARETAAVTAAGDRAPGPMSALAATIVTFAARLLANRRLAWAMLGEPVEPILESARHGFRQALTADLARRITAATARDLLPAQDALLSAAVVVGAVIEALIGPSATAVSDSVRERADIQAVTLLMLRALGVNDARARGLVVQVALPADFGR